MEHKEMHYKTQNHMTVEYERTIEDIIEFNLFHMSNSPSIRGQTLISQIIVLLLIFIGSLAIAPFFHPETRVLSYFDYIVAFVVSIVGFFVVPHFNRAEVRRAYRKASREGDNKAILGLQTISLTPENVFIKTQGGESKYNWSSVDKVTQNDKYIFLYISSINAIVIPIKAFSDGKSLQEFLNYVNAHREQKIENVS